MKKLFFLAMVAAAGLLAWNFATRGKLTLIPAAALSAEERQLEDLEQRLRTAGKTFSQAGRTAAISGLDTTSDAESARVEILAVEKTLNDMKRTATGSSKGRIEGLLSEARDLKRRIGAS